MKWDTERKLKVQNLPGDCFKEVDAAKYYEMLEVLPPQAMVKNSFLVGEPMRHENGIPVYECYFSHEGKHYIAGLMSEKTFASLLN